MRRKFGHKPRTKMPEEVSKERWREAKRQYAKRNPDVERLREHRKRARRRGLEATLTIAEWRAIVQSFDGLCAYCDSPWAEMDHKIPIVQGGPTTKENVVPACFWCSRSKG